MSLVTEDGTGKSDAESLCSVAAADTYHANRANTAWAAGTTAAKEAALRKSTDHMAAYRNRWAGCRVSTTQALDWPRYLVPMRDVAAGSYYPSDAVPAIVVNACAELALKALAGTILSPDVKPTATRVKVGPIEKEQSAYGRQTTAYTAVDNMLAPLLSASGSSLAVVRV